MMNTLDAINPLIITFSKYFITIGHSRLCLDLIETLGCNWTCMDMLGHIDPPGDDGHDHGLLGDDVQDQGGAGQDQEPMEEPIPENTLDPPNGLQLALCQTFDSGSSSNVTPFELVTMSYQGPRPFIVPLPIQLSMIDIMHGLPPMLAHPDFNAEHGPCCSN